MKTSHHTKILNLLDDNNWHCGNEITNLYIKDDRKRISELNKAGYKIVGEPCDMHKHTSRVYKRRLIKAPTFTLIQETINPRIYGNNTFQSN
jgi:hypothetical protein